MVPSDHFNCDTVSVGILYGLFGIGARRVEESQQPQKLPFPILVRLGDSQRSNAAQSKMQHIALDFL